jgi:hypothetical protein
MEHVLRVAHSKPFLAAQVGFRQTADCVRPFAPRIVRLVGMPGAFAAAQAYRRNRYSGLDGLKSSSVRPLVTMFEYL